MIKAETKFSFNVFSGKDCEFVKPYTRHIVVCLFKTYPPDNLLGCITGNCMFIG